MKAILYLSKATTDFSKEDLKALEAKSATNNAACDLSGYLYYDGAKFLQYLEGEEEQLMPLLKIIRDDPRQKILRKNDSQNGV